MVLTASAVSPGVKWAYEYDKKLLKLKEGELKETLSRLKTGKGQSLDKNRSNSFGNS